MDAKKANVFEVFVDYKRRNNTQLKFQRLICLMYLFII